MAGSAKGLSTGPTEVQGGLAVKQFDIQLTKKPSAVAGIAEALAQNGVSIRGISSDNTGNNTVVKVVTDDEATTRSTLVHKKATFSEREALSVVIHDRPGEIAKLTRRLARRMVQIESIYMLSREGGMTEVAFTADDMEKAQAVLKAWKG
jgi:hypothetical protein